MRLSFYCYWIIVCVSEFMFYVSLSTMYVNVCAWENTLLMVFSQYIHHNNNKSELLGKSCLAGTTHAQIIVLLRQQEFLKVLYTCSMNLQKKSIQGRKYLQLLYQMILTLLLQHKPKQQFSKLCRSLLLQKHKVPYVIEINLLYVSSKHAKVWPTS